MAKNKSSVDAPPSFFKRLLSTMLMFGALIGLAVLGWFAYEESQRPPDIGSIPLIKADTRPFKVKPEDPGGMEIPNTDKEVFNSISRTKIIDNRAEKILPLSEEPVSLEELLSVPAPFMLEDQKQDSTMRKVIKLSEVPSTPTIKNTAHASDLGVWVQLGSYRTEKGVKNGWNSLKKRFPRLLDTLNYTSKKVELENKGTFYRLHAGPFSDKDSARSLCKKLTAKKQGCLLAQ